MTAPASAVERDSRVFQDIRCPHCNRWLCAVQGGISEGRQIRILCPRCKQEMILPYPRSDGLAPKNKPSWRR